MTGALAAVRKDGVLLCCRQALGRRCATSVSIPRLRKGERSTLVSFLENGDSSGETGSTDQIIGIVGRMKAEMAADLKETTSGEEEAKGAFATQMGSKEQEKLALGGQSKRRPAVLVSSRSRRSRSRPQGHTGGPG